MNARRRALRVVCLECNKLFTTATSSPQCPRCNSADIWLREPRPAQAQLPGVAS